VRDAQAPVITCPADIVVTNAHDQATSVVTYVVTASDNCPGLGSPVCNPPSGTAFAVGLHKVECAVQDAAGNTARCSFNVLVRPGNQPPVPVISVSPLTVFPGWTNFIVLAPDYTNAVVTYDGSKSYDLDDTNFLCFWYEGTALFSTNAVAARTSPVGTHEISLWLDDTYPGGTSSASVTVEVITPSEGLGLIVSMLEESSLTRKTIRPLETSLKTAAASFESGNIQAGINQLNAFENKVNAQLAPIDPQLAGQLINAVQAVMASMGGK
jgi:hypothetical protein